MNARPLHLGASAYSLLQRWVHRGHAETVRVIVELLGAQPGDTVVEIGCGTGLLARHFTAHGFDYWGVDPDADRIAEARRIAGAHFLVGKANVLKTAGVPARRHAFIHGVLHHVDDTECRELVDFLLEFATGGRLVISEPVLPDRWWLNPAGTLLARLDEGAYVRRTDEWMRLFGVAAVDHVSVRPLWPRWPVSMLDVRLTRSRRGQTRDRPTAESSMEA